MNHILVIDWIIFVPYSKAVDEKLRSYWKRVVLRLRKILRWSYFFLRVNPEETLMLDCMGSEVINSTGGGANKLKQRNIENKLVI